MAYEYSSFFALMGITSAISLSAIGACYGTAKSALAIGGMGPYKPNMVMTSILPIIMAGILTIYGLIVSILISGGITSVVPFTASCIYMASGLSTGLTALASGYAIGIVGECGVRAYMQQPRLYTGMVVVLIFSEVLALYGLILSILMINSAKAMQ